MKSLNTHSINKIGIVILVFFFFYSCGEEQKSEKIVVKLKESVLTKKMLDSALAAEANKAKLKDEFVNDWIETEVLYQEAIKEGIQDDAEYLSLLNNSKKKLASTIYLKRMLSENDFTPSDNDVEKYYNDYKEDFRLKEDYFKLRFVRTDLFDKAVSVRSKILDTGWDKAKDYFRTDSTLVFSSESLYKSEIEPAILLRVVNLLLNNETSVVLEIEHGNFVIVSVEERFLSQTIPPFDLVKEKAKKLLTVLRQKEFVQEHIKKLIEEHNLEIERYSE